MHSSKQNELISTNVQPKNENILKVRSRTGAGMRSEAKNEPLKILYASNQKKAQ